MDQQVGMDQQVVMGEKHQQPNVLTLSKSNSIYKELIADCCAEVMVEYICGNSPKVR